MLQRVLPLVHVALLHVAAATGTGERVFQQVSMPSLGWHGQQCTLCGASAHGRDFEKTQSRRLSNNCVLLGK